MRLDSQSLSGLLLHDRLARHDGAHASRCIGLSSPLRPSPQWKPVKATPRAVDRRDLGRVATRLFMEGSATPSPSPTHTRMMTTAWNVKDQAATCAGCTLSKHQAESLH